MVLWSYDGNEPSKGPALHLEHLGYCSGVLTGGIEDNAVWENSYLRSFGGLSKVSSILTLEVGP